jgi:hypothetical protein
MYIYMPTYIHAYIHTSCRNWLACMAYRSPVSADCMSVCTCIYQHTYMHTCIHTYILQELASVHGIGHQTALTLFKAGKHLFMQYSWVHPDMGIQQMYFAFINTCILHLSTHVTCMYRHMYCFTHAFLHVFCFMHQHMYFAFILHVSLT